MFKGFSALAAGGLAIGLLAGAPMANAAEHGVTSGPATGSTVEPSTAVQKNNAQINAKKDTGEVVAGSVATGTPGVSAKRDTEAGPAPKDHNLNAENSGNQSSNK